jgi:hypothetical protein
MLAFHIQVRCLLSVLSTPSSPPPAEGTRCFFEGIAAWTLVTKRCVDAFGGGVSCMRIHRASRRSIARRRAALSRPARYFRPPPRSASGRAAPAVSRAASQSKTVASGLLRSNIWPVSSGTQEEPSGESLMVTSVRRIVAWSGGTGASRFSSTSRSLLSSSVKSHDLYGRGASIILECWNRIVTPSPPSALTLAHPDYLARSLRARNDE